MTTTNAPTRPSTSYTSSATNAPVDWQGVDDDMDFFDLEDFQPQAPPTALLIDLENYCSGSRHPRRVAAKLSQMLAAAGPCATTYAVASTDVADRQRTVLAKAGIIVVAVDAGPDAADLALLAEAQRLARTGVRHFVVASGDHIFARVAKLGELVVITHAQHEVSRRLASAAAEVRVAA